MGSAHFRAGVVTVVTDSSERVMAFERIDLPGQWQLPQGGIDDGETPDDAAWRELQEETGLTSSQVSLIGASDEWTVYQWPEGVRKKGRLGQAHRWYTFRVLDDEVEPTPDGVEFGSWRWVDRRWLVDNVVDFRRPSYRRVLLAD